MLGSIVSRLTDHVITPDHVITSWGSAVFNHGGSHVAVLVITLQGLPY